MIDESFTESFKSSCDKRYTCRLFRIPSDDGSIHMSIEVMMRNGGYVFYQLPNQFWLGTSELLDWDSQLDILFFTTNGQTKAFIFDVTFLNLVSTDIKLDPKDRLIWDDETKHWIIQKYLFTVREEDQNEKNPMHANYKPGNYFEQILALELPDPDYNSPRYKIIDTPYKRFKFVLKKVFKQHNSEHTIWELGIADTKNLTWVVKKLPYFIKGADTLRLSHNKNVSTYGFSTDLNYVYLFLIDLESVEKEQKVSLFIHDFEPMRPAEVVWDEKDSFWRAVINGEVIAPRPFYYDNTYSSYLPVEGTPLPSDILELLPKESLSQPTTAGQTINSAVDPQTSGNPTLPEDKKEEDSFLTSGWFLLLIFLLMAATGLCIYFWSS